MQRWQFTSDSPAATRALGVRLGALLREDLAIFLDGELGSGKTCLTQGLAAGLGIAADEAVTSPTYTLMNHYRGRLDLYHFDLYRLAGADDLDAIGFEEYAAAPGVIVVEWAALALPPDRPGLHVALSHASGERRILTFTAHSPAASALLDDLAAGCDQRGVAP
ncbi:tRNA (adenosine(37)-N6)-threonylcarbamoyltransferase complex ATPase subunit type 1 TsaE [Desulfuromonas carbonis]|uniref:tRNA (adenosine(37)-N6)-threonylcarbamoyltransferase complex ATPase subunit type 1 TsaE n=1 Tax=Desulfuromonas sp. DDH964 TaxID=1823759 RepID=UPI00078B3FE2|nr:tRNA (adenosine(37)-N6)-threonylcarbamoyltransferase complex ATPase subunit type 1 TsaE [Desulfuromonas sp. DDH964]AMV71603.1 nucleoid maintenance ATPase YjeE [Desulfuromonas sp. DDH964]